MNFFTPKACLVCAEKEIRIAGMIKDLERSRHRISILEDKLSTAIDQLLAKAGQPALTPPTRYTQQDAEQIMEETFAFFKDTDDKGDGNIREADQLDYDRRPQK